MKKKVIKKQNQSRNCFVCGVENGMGLHAEFYELEDGSLAALVAAGPGHQSYPQRVHGGISTALLDETIGRAINISEPDTWGVTVELAANFRRPVPYGVPLIVTGRITENNRLLFTGVGSLILPDGEEAVTATAKYMKMTLSKIADFEAEGDFWKECPREDDPKEIEIPEKKEAGNKKGCRS